MLLYSVADCAVTATRNDQDEQYTFDKGFTGFGTGAAAGDPAVTTAMETSCGELVAGRDGPVEPS